MRMVDRARLIVDMASRGYCESEQSEVATKTGEHFPFLYYSVILGPGPQPTHTS